MKDAYAREFGLTIERRGKDQEMTAEAATEAGIKAACYADTLGYLLTLLGADTLAYANGGNLACALANVGEMLIGLTSEMCTHLERVNNARKEAEKKADTLRQATIKEMRKAIKKGEWPDVVN